MPSIVVNMGVIARTLVTEKLDSKSKPTLVLVDNVNGLGDADLIFSDNFTPSVTNGVPAPVPPQVISRLQINVAAGECVSVEDTLKDVHFLGTVIVTRGVVLDPNCFVTYAYHFDEDEEES